MDNNKTDYDLTEEQWKRIEPLLPLKNTGRKRTPGKRQPEDAERHAAAESHSGAQWREIPKHYDPWQSIYSRFATWRNDGIREEIFSEPSQDADTENLSMHSTCKSPRKRK